MKKLLKTVFCRCRRLAAAAVFLCLCLGGVLYSQGAEIPGVSKEAGKESQRVFDRAGLFSDGEIKSLEQETARLRDDTGMDAVIVTEDDVKGMSTREYADNFYIQGSFGNGKEYDGILFLIDMDNRELYVNAVGKMNRYITDERRETILDAVYEGASEGDFAASAEQFLASVSAFYKEGIPEGQHNYDEQTGKVSVYQKKSVTWEEGLFAVGVSAFAGLGACLNVVNGYAMKKERRRADNYYMAYRADCGFRFADETDSLINKTVSQMVIPRAPRPPRGPGGGAGGGFSGRTTTHTSSGRTFGGGGRKF